MPAPIRLGFFSFAHMHAASYAHSAQSLPDVEIAGIYDDNRSRGEEWAAKLQSRFFPTAEALLAEQLDGAIICAENVNHRPLVEKCAGRVKAILCEKPIATNLADGQAIIDSCHQSGTKLQIAFPVRFSPAIRNLKSQLDAGSLGEIYSAKCTNHGSMPGGWFVDQQLAGGGAVIDHTVHVVDALRWLWGAEVTEVYAEIGDSLLHPGLGIDDAGLLSFRLSNGIYGTLDTSWSRPPSYPTWGDVKIEMLGERGLVRVDAFQQHVAVSSNAAGKTRWAGWGSNIDSGLVADFVEMIREGRQPFITGHDGLKALEVALAAYESARTGRPVSINH